MIDPDKLLAELRALIKEMVSQETCIGLSSYQNWLLVSGVPERIAILIENLDTHISQGGPLPAAWLPATFAKRKMMLTCSGCGEQFHLGASHVCISTTGGARE